MRNAELKISVVVVEESDLAGVNDEARVSGKMESIRRGIAEQFDRSFSVQVGMSEDSRRGSVPWVSIGGVRLRVGEAVGRAEDHARVGPARLHRLIARVMQRVSARPAAHTKARQLYT